MDYRENTVQRVFSIRFSAGDRLVESLAKLAREKNIRSAAVTFSGDFSKGQFRIGLRKYSRAPMDVNPITFSDVHQAEGVGSIAWEDDQPRIRLQAAIAREREVFVAGVEEAEAADAEAVILELGGI